MLKGANHTEPILADIPGARRQPDATIRRAYWYAVRLHNYGWTLRSIEYRSKGISAQAEAVIENPCHRLITYQAGHQQRTATELPEVFTMAVCAVGMTKGQNGIRDLRTQLRPLLQTPVHCPVEHHARTRADLFRIARQAGQRLIEDYRWTLSGLGSEVAGGGFIADIPGDVLAIYPAGMAGDGTAAADLAHAIGNLDNHQLDALVQHLNWYQHAVQLRTQTPGQERAS